MNEFNGPINICIWKSKAAVAHSFVYFEPSNPYFSTKQVYVFNGFFINRIDETTSHCSKSITSQHNHSRSTLFTSPSNNLKPHQNASRCPKAALSERSALANPTSSKPNLQRNLLPPGNSQHGQHIRSPWHRT